MNTAPRVALLATMDKEELIGNGAGRAKNGINLFVATAILTGEMAGSGMLQLPYSMVGTGKFI